MSSNWEVLVSKFSNFRVFIKEIAKSPTVHVFEKYTDQQFLGFSCILMKFHEEGKLGELVDRTLNELEIELIHRDKVMRYFLCFISYLGLLKEEKVPQLVPVKVETEEPVQKE